MRQRPGGVVLELGAAAAVLALIALTMGGALGETTPASPPVARSWPARALPVLTALVDDLSAVDAASKTVGTAEEAFGTTRSNFVDDVGRAHALGPPGGALGNRWSGVLAQVDVVAGALGVDGTGSQNTQLRPEAEGAADALVSFVASMEHQRG